ncbi:MAG: restriction endonuclease subunit S [Verrucomicrobiota bacterium]
MIAHLQPYPEYKESEQAWLGRVPQHWPVLPNRALFAEVKDREHSDEEMLSVTINKGIIRQKALLTDSSKKDSSRQDKSAYKLVQPRDVAYNKMRAWQGAIGASDFRGILSPAYVVMRLREQRDLPRYFHHLYRTPHFAKEAERWSYGITSDLWSLRPEHFKMIYTPQPPPEEQAAMVRFLDYANGRLERAIRAKRKVIALLHEQKQAIIHRAVTRGLDPTVPLKPSGIPWLGDIPKHWEVTALRRYWQVTDCKHLTVPFVEDGIPLASVVEVQSFSLKLTRCKKTKPEWYRVLIEGGRKPKRGDLIYCRNASVGACALVETDIDFAMGQDVCLIRSQSQNQRFLNYLLHSPFMEHQLELLLVGSTFKRINISEIKALAVLVPQKHEQDAICEFLDSELATYDTAIARLEREIGLLREYRTRLVADVVTGKLDVRPAARQLPEEGGEQAGDLSEEADPSDSSDSSDEMPKE